MNLRRNFLIGLAWLFKALHIISKGDYENYRLNLALIQFARDHKLRLTDVALHEDTEKA